MLFLTVRHFADAWTAVFSFLLCVTVIDFLLLFLQVVLQPELLVGSRVFLHEIRYQNRLQQAEQHHSKNHNAVGRYERSLVGHGGKDVIQDEQQDGDGQQHGHFEAQLLSSMVCYEEGGDVQTQEEQDG